MRIAVAGANGFVGRHLIRLLSNQGVTVVPIGRSDIAPSALRTALAGCGALVNCAGNKDGRGAAAREANVALPLCLLNGALAANVSVMVHVSSVAALVSRTAPGETVTDNYSGPATSIYGRSKREGDDALLQTAHERGYDALAVLRPPILIGDDAGGVFGLLRSMALAGVPLPLAGADNRRSVMHVDNFATAILAAVRTRCWGAFIVSDSPPLSTADLYARMLIAVGYGPRLFSVGRTGRALLRSIMGHRGESLFGNAAFRGDRFVAATQVRWPIPANSVIERAMIADQGKV